MSTEANAAPEPHAIRARVARGRRFALAVVGFSVLAVSLRALYLERVAPPIPPVSDASGYYAMGRNLAEGHGFVSWMILAWRGEEVPSAEYPPGYPALLAIVNLLGVTTKEGQRIVVALLSAVNVPLVALLGRALYGGAAGLVAAALAAVSPALIEIDGSFMSEALYVPLIALGLLGVRRAAGRTAPGPWLLAGAVFGAAALVRSEALILVALLPLPLAVLAAPLRRPGPLAALAVGLAALVLPWTLRNAFAVGSFVPVSQGFKGVLLGANCAPAYDEERRLGGWTYGCNRLVDVTGLSEAEAFDARRDYGVRYALDHWRQLPEVLLARLERTWGLYRAGSGFGVGEIEIRNSAFSRRTAWFGWALLLLAVPGLVLIGRRSRTDAWLLLAPVVAVSVTSLVAYGNPRFRAAAEPSLLVLAAVATTALAAAGSRTLKRASASRDT